MGITILLVEDNALNRDMLSRRLIKRGYDIKIAINGEEGIRMAEEYLPEIILMDLSLPIIDGWEATRTIKSRAITKNIPIIALTAHAMSGDEAKAKAAGCNDYDTKPIDLNRLLDKINNLLFPNIL
jgi:two-component system cell cycle response regulator DivK